MSKAKTKPPQTKSAAPLKDPKGGLTAAGRKHFAKTEGAHLKPGVKKVRTAEDERRKGSFLRRFYGRSTISPLTDKKGEPTRYAKAAAAWGEKVPKTQADVDRLARKGTKLLDQAAKASAKSSPPAKATSARPTKSASRKVAGEGKPKAKARPASRRRPGSAAR